MRSPQERASSTDIKVVTRSIILSSLTPHDFLEKVVLPNITEFKQDVSSERHAYNAISGLDALAAHIYHWAKASGDKEAIAATNDSHYRGSLAKRNMAFGLLRDVAKAQKHVRLDRHDPIITDASQINSRPIGFGEGGFGGGRFGGVAQVVIDIDVESTRFEYVENILDQALVFLAGEIKVLDVPQIKA